MSAKHSTQCLARPERFDHACASDALPYHPGSSTNPTEESGVPTADIYSAVDSAVAIWQAVSGSAGE